MAAATAHGAEWTLTPDLGVLVDTDNNRYLSPQSRSSQSSTLSASAQFEAATESNDLSFSPVVHWQDFDTSAYPSIFERDFSVADTWTATRSKLTVSAEDADHSTLTTEATETGILNANLHQRLDQAGASETYNETERWSAILQASYADVSYYGSSEGALLDLLQGYRYPSASIAQQYLLDESSSATGTISYAQLEDRTEGHHTQQSGASLEYQRSFTDRISVDLSLGATRVNNEGELQTSTTGSFTLSRSYSLGTVSLAYSRAFVPYGNGALADREQMSIAASRALTEELNLTVNVGRVKNSQTDQLSYFGFGITIREVQSYDSVGADLGWQFAETWKLDAAASGTRTQPLGSNVTVNEWRASLAVTWNPHPLTTSF